MASALSLSGSALSVSHLKEKEHTNKVCLSQSESESISKEKGDAKMEKKTTTKKSKELKIKVDTKRKRKELQRCNPEKSTPFRRVWSKEDEIALLKGIKLFDKVEIPPNKKPQRADLFFKFIKDDIHFAVSKIQLNSKISKLKVKFEKNMKFNRCTFDDPHKQILYDLSKLIWKLKVKDCSEVIAKELKVSDSDEAITKKQNALESYFRTDGKEHEMKKYFILGLSSLEGSKKKEMIEEYWQWFLCMMDLIGKQNDIIHKYYNSVMSAYKSY
ncbi:hypothetical protein SADUNF_Sadunf19G0059000 [Salix dunnii]|uniref:Glabrous enhancer-binding protein-like DBD domain-containing protein n=1 Tax=Salix dunnii TaxID=1413687 RepID=A0A835J1G2_9ROSI|nr:hypothetical protein SADUNF_Sadunf19G0059000 [Salix dunnii]